MTEVIQVQPTASKDNSATMSSSADDLLLTSMPNQLNRTHECRGEVLYSGTLYHGGATDNGDVSQLQPVDYKLMYLTPMGAEVKIEDATLGAGYYLCADIQRASRYADYKRRQFGDYPYLRSLEVTNLPLYDFRDANDHEANGTVPVEMMEGWQQYFTQNKAKILAFVHNNLIESNKLDTYEWQLQDLINSYKAGKAIDRGYDIQSMLYTQTQDPSHGFGCVPLWSGLFSSFMSDEYHVDGFIANQGGEDSTWDSGATYVLTKLDNAILATQTVTPVG